MLKKLINKIKLQKNKKKLMGNAPKIDYKFKKDGLYHDKVEKTKEYKQCIKAVEKLAEEKANETGHVGKGYCHIVWGFKKEILKEQYNIDWRTPAEMNPHCKFD